MCVKVRVRRTTRYSGGLRMPYSQRELDLLQGFAQAALTGLLSRDLTSNSVGNTHINHAQVRTQGDYLAIAINSFNYAEAMLKEFGKRNIKE